MKTGDADIDIMMDTLLHDVREDELHPLSKARRWTCCKCGMAVISCGRVVYGSATKAVCNPVIRRSSEKDRD